MYYYLLLIPLIVIIHIVVRYFYKKYLIDLIFSSIVFIISLTQMVYISYLQLIYTVFLSSMPLFKDFSQPLILVYDPLSAINIFFISLIYLINSVKRRLNIYLLLFALFSIIMCSLIDLLSIAIFLILLTTIVYLSRIIDMDRRGFLIVESLLLIMFTISIMFLGHFNLGYINYLYRAGILSATLYNIGLSLVALALFSIFFLLLGFTPFTMRGVHGYGIENILVANTLLIPILRILFTFGNSELYHVMGYAMYIIGLVNLYGYMLYLFKNRGAGDGLLPIEYFLLLSGFMVLPVNASLTIQLFLAAIYIHGIIHSSRLLDEEIIVLSRYGVFPLLGFIPLAYLIVSLYITNPIFAILLSIPIIFYHVALIHKYSHVMLSRDAIFFIIVSLVTLLATYYLFHTSALILLEQGRYKNIVFG